MSSPSGRQTVLSAHQQELVVVEVGGGIRSYSAGGEDVLDGYDAEEMCAGGRGQLLAPWPNRLGDGRFEWRGRSHQLPINEVETTTAIHGLVRWSAWTVQSIGTGRARMAHRLHPQPGWPWTLDFWVDYRLEPAGLTVETTVANAGSVDLGPCPLGLGWHPYLRPAGGGPVDRCTLTVPAATAYRADGRGLPTGTHPVAGSAVDFSSGRVIGADAIDTAFTDLVRDADGRATVELSAPSGATTRLWVDGAYSHLMVFTGDTLADTGRRRHGLAAEPMTGPPDLLRSGDGRRVLEPGQKLTATWGLQPPG